MTIFQNAPVITLLTRFDDELKNLLLTDLKAFRASKNEVARVVIQEEKLASA